jgi:hypothetical protein
VFIDSPFINVCYFFDGGLAGILGILWVLVWVKSGYYLYNKEDLLVQEKS